MARMPKTKVISGSKKSTFVPDSSPKGETTKRGAVRSTKPGTSSRKK